VNRVSPLEQGVQSADDRVIDYRISLHGAGIGTLGALRSSGTAVLGPAAGTPTESRAPVRQRASLVAFTVSPGFPTGTGTSVIHDVHLLA